jgi:hypothetical protein
MDKDRVRLLLMMMMMMMIVSEMGESIDGCESCLLCEPEREWAV